MPMSTGAQPEGTMGSPVGGAGSPLSPMSMMSPMCVSPGPMGVSALPPSSPLSEYLPFMSTTHPVQYFPPAGNGSVHPSCLASPLLPGALQQQQQQHMQALLSPLSHCSSPGPPSPGSPISLAMTSATGGMTVEQAQMAGIAEPLDRLKYFLTTAPANWRPGDIVKRFLMGNNEQISCVYWKGLFYISGTDIVKILQYRFHLMSRPIVNAKKFEEGVFSDLRNLKAGLDAALEEPRSPFLEVLYRNGCIRTQKKQKVFYWYSVPHERLFHDALERDLKREQMSIAQNAFLNRNMMAVMSDMAGPGSAAAAAAAAASMTGSPMLGPAGLYQHMLHSSPAVMQSAGAPSAYLGASPYDHPHAHHGHGHGHGHAHVHAQQQQPASLNPAALLESCGGGGGGGGEGPCGSGNGMPQSHHGDFMLPFTHHPGNTSSLDQLYPQAAAQVNVAPSPAGPGLPMKGPGGGASPALMPASLTQTSPPTDHLSYPSPHLSYAAFPSGHPGGLAQQHHGLVPDALSPGPNHGQHSPGAGAHHPYPFSNAQDSADCQAHLYDNHHHHLLHDHDHDHHHHHHHQQQHHLPAQHSSQQQHMLQQHYHQQFLMHQQQQQQQQQQQHQHQQHQHQHQLHALQSQPQALWNAPTTQMQMSSSAASLPALTSAPS